MAGLMLNWNMKKLVISICDRLQNRFDAFIVIEGLRGLGKSTLAYKLMKLVKQEMKNRKVDGYKFSPRRDLLYERMEVIKFFNDRRRSAIADEMVNVSFSRDFYNEDQKDLIKIINMNRDHENFCIACIPHFKNLDTQIKKLCSMRVTVVRRGLAIIQTPNKTIYSADIWDETLNEKIERDWLRKGVTRPHYSKLTTFRGFLRFPKLSEKQELIYQKIKDEKRNKVAQQQGLEEEEETDPLCIIYNALIEKKVKNSTMLDGMIMGNRLDINKTKRKLYRKLKVNNKSSSLNEYYFGKEDQMKAGLKDLTKDL